MTDTNRSLPARLFRFFFKFSIFFILLSVGLTVIYSFTPVPITATMLLDDNGDKREWVSIDDVSPNLVRAIMAAEDSKFCVHNGFDREAIETAIKRNAEGGRIRGGSTISQQTAKNVFLWQGGGYFRKGLEAYFTFLIENIWNKRRIMEAYLNVAETGIGTYGVEAGAQRYFKKSAKSLTRTQAARLAAALPLPKKRSVNNPKGFTRRHGNSIAARINVVKRDRLDVCILGY